MFCMKFLKRNRLAVGIALIILVMAAASFVLSNISKAVVSSDYSWNSTERSQPFGLDSSGMRVAYSYSLDASSYHPLYKSKDRKCEVLSRLDKASASITQATDERQGSKDILASYTNQKVDSFTEKKLIFNGDASVPVQYVSYEENGKFYGVFARWFKAENLTLIVMTHCESKEGRVATVNAVLDSFRLVANKPSKF